MSWNKIELFGVCKKHHYINICIFFPSSNEWNCTTQWRKNDELSFSPDANSLLVEVAVDPQSCNWKTVEKLIRQPTKTKVKAVLFNTQKIYNIFQYIILGSYRNMSWDCATSISWPHELGVRHQKSWDFYVFPWESSDLIWGFTGFTFTSDSSTYDMLLLRIHPTHNSLDRQFDSSYSLDFRKTHNFHPLCGEHRTSWGSKFFGG